MDFNKLRVFGFPRHVLNYNLYNPTKIRYLKSKDFGYFEAPKRNKIPELRYLVDQYKQRVEYEKHMNPKGFKLNITSKFPKVGDTVDFVNPKFYLVRSGKRYEDNEIKFLIDKNMNKDEAKQVFEKLYRVRAEKISTAIVPGQVKQKVNQKNGRSFYRIPDRKKAVIQVGFPVDQSLRRLTSLNQKKEENKNKKI
jgi:ribosomal protein L23